MGGRRMGDESRKSMIRYLLDTNAWLNLREAPERLSQSSRLILASEMEFAISPMSIVEIAQKASRGRLVLKCTLDTWVAKSIGSIVTVLPISPEIAIEAYRLPDFHNDPADRIIAATARFHGLILVTSDRKMLDHPSVPTLSTR